LLCLGHHWTCDRISCGAFHICHLYEASSSLLCVCPIPSCNNEWFLCFVHQWMQR
jgi:hypothetical protein